jgi:chaperone required for assembly of F1-ATPase
MKRFYTDVATAAQDGGWRVLLDGRPIRTQGGRPQTLPTPSLADACAQEWAAQPAQIDPQAFALRDMADFALDAVAPDPATSIAALIPYAETDTLCYRADPDEPLHARQHAIWEPLLTATEQREGLTFTRISGVIHRAQPPETIAHLRARFAAFDPFRLAALRNLASLSASLVIALAALEPDADLPALWSAASLEEEWQADLWGRDAEAEQRRALRAEAFATAARFASLAQ